VRLIEFPATELEAPSTLSKYRSNLLNLLLRQLNVVTERIYFLTALKA
jgi:hypothetical protein